MPNFNVTVPVATSEAEYDNQLWVTFSAVTESVETGSSHHCVERIWGKGPDGSERIIGYRHVRLGVTVRRELINGWRAVL